MSYVPVDKYGEAQEEVDGEAHGVDAHVNEVVSPGTGHT